MLQLRVLYLVKSIFDQMFIMPVSACTDSFLKKKILFEKVNFLKKNYKLTEIRMVKKCILSYFHSYFITYYNSITLLGGGE